MPCQFAEGWKNFLLLVMPTNLTLIRRWVRFVIDRTSSPRTPDQNPSVYAKLTSVPSDLYVEDLAQDNHKQNNTLAALKQNKQQPHTLTCHFALHTCTPGQSSYCTPDTSAPHNTVQSPGSSISTAPTTLQAAIASENASQVIPHAIQCHPIPHPQDSQFACVLCVYSCVHPLCAPATSLKTTHWLVRK